MKSVMLVALCVSLSIFSACSAGPKPGGEPVCGCGKKPSECACPECKGPGSGAGSCGGCAHAPRHSGCGM